MTTFKEHDEELQKLLKRMDVPAQRKHDYRWLARNLSINNRNRPNIQKALVLISILLEQD